MHARCLDTWSRIAGTSASATSARNTTYPASRPGCRPCEARALRCIRAHKLCIASSAPACRLGYFCRKTQCHCRSVNGHGSGSTTSAISGSPGRQQAEHPFLPPLFPPPSLLPGCPREGEASLIIQSPAPPYIHVLPPGRHSPPSLLPPCSSGPLPARWLGLALGSSRLSPASIPPSPSSAPATPRALAFQSSRLGVSPGSPGPERRSTPLSLLVPPPPLGDGLPGCLA